MSAKRTPIGLVALFAVACGGGDDRARHPRGGRGRGGTRADQLSGEAAAKFTQAVQAYQQAVQAGWNEERCTRVADLFQEAFQQEVVFRAV